MNHKHFAKLFRGCRRRVPEFSSSMDRLLSSWEKKNENLMSLTHSTRWGTLTNRRMKFSLDNLHSGMQPLNTKVQLHIPRSMIWILYLEREAQRIQGMKAADIHNLYIFPYIFHKYQLNRTSNSYHVGK